MNRAPTGIPVLALSMLLLGPWPHPLQVQSPSIEWPASVTAAEKTQLLELAKRAGIDRPKEITTQLIHMPLGCEAIEVRSDVTVDGNRRSWTQVWIGNQDKQYYCTGRPQAPSVGAWVIETDAWTAVTWRISDGEWQRDVFLQGVPYEVAAKLVLAMKRHTFVDRRKANERRIEPMNAVDNEATVSQSHGKYEVMSGRGGSGFIAELSIEGKDVVLLSVATWIS